MYLMQRLYFEMKVRVKLIKMFHFIWYLNYFLSLLERLSSEHRPIGAGTSEKLGITLRSEEDNVVVCMMGIDGIDLASGLTC